MNTFLTILTNTIFNATNHNSFLSSSLLEIKELWNKLPDYISSQESIYTRFVSLNIDVTNTININLYSFSALMLLMLVFIKNYSSKNFTDLKEYLNILINTTFYALLFCLFYMNVVLINVAAIDVYTLVMLVVISIFSLLLFNNSNITNNLNSINFIIVGLTAVCFGWAVLSNLTTDFALLLICLEGFSLSLYILATIGKTYGGISASIKYFAFGTLGSILMLFGAINIYGDVNSLNLLTIIQFYDTNTALAGLLIILGLFVKLGAAPSHQWVPDVYSGVQLIITAFYSIIVKFVLFVIFLYWSYYFYFFGELEYVAILSIIIGCIGAIRQTEIKRLLAYASITHVGYLFSGDLNAAWLYIIVYMISSFVFFLVLLNIKLNNKEMTYLTDLRFVGKEKNQLNRTLLVIALSSMAGLPPFAGFYGKMFVWTSIIEDIYIYNDTVSMILLLINLITSLFVIFYYMRVMAILYINDEQVDTQIVTNNYQSISLTSSNFVGEKNLYYLQVFGVVVLSLWTFVMPFILTVINSIVF